MKNWLNAFRLRTLPLALSGIIIGVALSVQSVDFNLTSVILIFVTAILLQILSNLANEYGDFEHGLDNNSARKGPSRTIQRGEITPKAMKNAVFIAGGLAFISGCTLLYFAFRDDILKVVLFLILGLGSIWAAVKYTMGKSPYGYKGLGDIFVFVFFGFVSVLGTSFILTKNISGLNFLPAMAIGLFSTGVLNVNNIRDIESDKVSGKFSLPVQLGLKNAVKYHLLLLFIGVTCLLTFSLLNPDTSIWGFLYVLTFPLFGLNGFKVYKNQKDPILLDPLLKQLALSTFFCSILFLVGQVLN